MRFTVIGISDHPQPDFSRDIQEVITRGKIFSGGKRHHEIVASFLPAEHEWIDITVPLAQVFEKYKAFDDIVVFASGDPLFFGFANTLKREFPYSEITTYPTFNSLQLLAHRLMLPYHDMHIVSLTGRPWHEFDRTLIEGVHKIGVLTDKEHTPAAIASRMKEYGFTDYLMYVGEHLGNHNLEHITTCTLSEAIHTDFRQPNCLILEGHHQRRWGIPDQEFRLLDGRKRMITKMPIRLLSLQALELHRKRTFWDIGFCTGSISIEAKLQFPHLHVESFEVRPECEEIILENCRRFSAPGINIHIGDFLTTDCSELPRPDAVFIGGHGGKLKEIMQNVCGYLEPGGCIVMNSVTPQSKMLFEEACNCLSLKTATPLHIQLNDYNPIDILKCELP